MLRVINNDIHITKGDTGYISLTIKNRKGNNYIVRDGDALTLTVKKNLTNAEVIKKQETGSDTIQVAQKKWLLKKVQILMFRMQEAFTTM